VNSDFDAGIDEVAHRPWAMPERPWVMTQSWHDLLFAHWKVDVRQLRSRVPSPFELDLFEGDAWLGVVPFYMTNVSPRGVPSLPWVSEFAELNVRTYVRVADKPGVYFFSLDAASALAVQTARALLNLPYHTATMMRLQTARGIEYHSSRTGGAAQFDATYAPVSTAFVPTAGSLEHFLTERYCLYHVDHRGTPYRLDIHHRPWRLQVAHAQIDHNKMAQVHGFNIGRPADLLHFAGRQDMVAWLPATVP
jgi:uncharacterized protein YqjF (DUF2071 family)